MKEIQTREEGVVYYSEKEGSKNAALIFQGQGTQEVGMGRDLYNAYPEVRNLYDTASFYLRGILSSRSLLDLTDGDLKRTDLTQLAIFVHSEACRIDLIKKRERSGQEPIKPKFYAGNSLGEFNALYAAGAFSLKDALYILLARGSAQSGMQKACIENPGSLMAIFGNHFAISEILKEITDKKKNYKLFLEADNSETQIVVGGSLEALKEVQFLLDNKYGHDVKKRPLNVAGAFHSPLMKPAERRLKQVVKRLGKLKRIKKLEVPVVANTTAKPIKYSWEVEREIVRQLTRPVLWRQTIEFLESNGVAATVELGKKSILSPMMGSRGKIVMGTALGLGAFATFLYFRHRK